MTYTYNPRRSFLRFVVRLITLGLSRPVLVLAKVEIPGTPDPLTARLTAFFSSPESAAAIGRKYLQRVPEEADECLLLDLICSSRADRRVGFANADAWKLREMLRLQQRQDFEAGRIVNIQGWLLSETEARLCALLALN